MANRYYDFVCLEQAKWSTVAPRLIPPLLLGDETWNRRLLSLLLQVALWRVTNAHHRTRPWPVRYRTRFVLLKQATGVSTDSVCKNKTKETRSTSEGLHVLGQLGMLYMGHCMSLTGMRNTPPLWHVGALFIPAPKRKST